MTGWTRAYLSIGSNKGDTGKNLDQAAETLTREINIRVLAESGRYKTAPQNFADQDWFLNAVLEIDTCLSPEALLKRLKNIESELDPEGKDFRFGPRIIDLDIVLFGDQVLKTDHLEIPHPRMHQRCFVLKPLSDLVPDLVHPRLNQTIQQLLEQMNTQENQEVIPLEQEENREIFH